MVGRQRYRHKVPEADLWDATAHVARAGTLVIGVRRFTLTRRNAHDNVKALVYSIANFAAGPRSILTIEADMCVETFRGYLMAVATRLDAVRKLIDDKALTATGALGDLPSRV